jgi:acyl carrier protein
MIADSQLFNSVATVLCTVLGIDGKKLDRSTRLIRDLNAESIDFLDISCELEKVVDVELDFRNLMKRQGASCADKGNDLTVGEIVDYLAEFEREVGMTGSAEERHSP